MVLSTNEIVTHRLNWEPKSQNIQAIATELNLSLNSFIFIDDNPVECAEMRAVCPAVLTLQFPKEEREISSFRRNLLALDRLVVTEEDKHRSAQYITDRRRMQSRSNVSSLKDFITTLKLQIKHHDLNAQNLARASQMTKRTNQFNTTSIRRAEANAVPSLSTTTPASRRCRFV